MHLQFLISPSSYVVNIIQLLVHIIYSYSISNNIEVPGNCVVS